MRVVVWLGVSAVVVGATNSTGVDAAAPAEDETVYKVGLVIVTLALLFLIARFVRREFFAQSRFQNCFVKCLRRFPGCAMLPCVQAIDASLPSYAGHSGGVHGKLGVNVKRNPYFERQPLASASRNKKLAQEAIDGATTGKYVQMEGFLEKTDGAGWAWQKRWFVLFNDRLRYYESRRTQAPLGEFVLSSSLLAFYAHPTATTQHCFQLLTTEESDIKTEKGAKREKAVLVGGEVAGGGALGGGARVTHFCTRGNVLLEEWLRGIANNMGAAPRPGALEASTGALVRANKARGGKAGKKTATLDGGEDDPTVSEMNPMYAGAATVAQQGEKRKGSMSSFLKFHFANK